MDVSRVLAQAIDRVSDLEDGARCNRLRYTELVSCERGNCDGEFYQHCCLREDAMGCRVWALCDMEIGGACPFGVLPSER